MGSELIKKHDLEKDEPRPLYMDFQATTPMVTTRNHDVSTAYITVRKGCKTDSLMRVFSFVYMIRTHECWMPCCPSRLTTTVTHTPEHMLMAGRVRLPWRQPGRFVYYKKTSLTFFMRFKASCFNNDTAFFVLISWLNLHCEGCLPWLWPSFYSKTE